MCSTSSYLTIITTHIYHGLRDNFQSTLFQVAIFYLAGFDTTASAISYTLFELSRNADLMKRLHNEIDNVLEKHNNVISYESIKEMTFLEHCVLGTVGTHQTISNSD